ncbi:hypothetical protein [Rubidibacter lacunae]|uniref:hypothetical protein n=1 Tax=Rubidibacter lacunae TaxID=582514 RepID=UPI000404F7B9|nr:hypothetical protein [Rubidibacter lacunae]
MAKTSGDSWSELSARPESGSLGESSALETVTGEFLLELGVWREVLQLLECHTEDPDIDGSGCIRWFDAETLTKLAKELPDTYPSALREVLKQDFAQRGEAFVGLLLDPVLF